MLEIVPLELTEQNIRQLSCIVLADIDKDGIPETDITNDVESIDYVNVDLENKNPGMVIGKPSSSNASITIFNEEGKYSPNNINSPYFDKYKINTRINIEAGFIDETDTPRRQEIFSGVITTFNNKYSLDGTIVTNSLKDLAKFAQRKDNPNDTVSNGKVYKAVLFDVTIPQAVDYLIDYVYGETFERIISGVEYGAIKTYTGTKFPVIEFPKNEKVWNTIQKLAEACDARAYFEHGVFKFLSPLYGYVYSSASVYHFTTDNISDFTEDVDEENIINKWKITSNGKTLQPKQVVVGTPSNNILTSTEEYKSGDGKNALEPDNKTIVLKYQEGETWIDTIYVPLVETVTYSDLIDPTQEDIDAMNKDSIVKVYDKNTGEQLTIYSIDYNLGKIILKDPIDPNNYNLQITYQYYIDRVIANKYKWYEFELEDITKNIGENGNPDVNFNFHDSYNEIPYVFDIQPSKVCITDWKILDGNQRIKFKITNNYSSLIYIDKLEIYGNPLKCTTSLVIESTDPTNADFINSYEIANDYIIDENFGKELVDEYYHRYSQYRSYLQAKTKGIPQIQLLDRVTVTENKSGIDFDFIVIGYKHTIKDGKWETLLLLESAIATWTYEGRSEVISSPSYTGSQLVLPEISILSNSNFEDVFNNDTITHNVVLNFQSPASYNISNFLECNVLLQEKIGEDWGRYQYVGSFTDPFTNSYKVSGLSSDKIYKFYIVAYDKFGNQSPYGNGYELNTPTTIELQNYYGLLPVPDNVYAAKAVNADENNKAVVIVSSAPCPSTYRHYKTTVFEMVQKDLLWSDPSKEVREAKTNSIAFTIPDENIYKFRIAFKDIWDRVGIYSPDSNLVTGGKITNNDVSAELLEINVTSSVNPISGILQNLYDATETTVVFDCPVTITYNYPVEHLFNLVRLKTKEAESFYVEYFDSDEKVWKFVVGTNEEPVTTIANDITVFSFKQDGIGSEIRRRTRQIRITFTSACEIEELNFDVFGYYDTLIVRDGEIKSAKISSIEADKIKVGGSAPNIPLAINPATDHLWHFDGSLMSTQGIQSSFSRASVAYLSDGTQVAANVPRFEAGKFGKAVMVEEGTTNLLSSNDATGRTLFGSNNGAYSTNSLVSNFGRSDSYSIQSTQVQAGANQGFYTPAYTVSPNTAYTGSTYVYTTLLNKQFVLYIAWYDSGGAYVGKTTESRVSLNANSWTRLTSSGIAPANAATCRLLCLESTTSAIGDVYYFDDLQLEQKPYPTSFIVGTRSPATLTIPTAGVLDPQEGTMECWFYYKPNNAYQRIVSFVGAALNGYRDLQFDVINTGYVRFQPKRLADGTGAVYVLSASPITEGWHYAVCTWNQSEIKVAVDNQPVQRLSYGGGIATLDTYFTVGKEHNATFAYLNSLIDELLILPRAASDEEIAAWYNMSAPFYDPSDHIDASGRPITAGNGAVVIDSTGAWGIANGVKQAGFGTDGKWIAGGGAVVADKDGMRFYDISNPQNPKIMIRFVGQTGSAEFEGIMKAKTLIVPVGTNRWG